MKIRRLFRFTSRSADDIQRELDEEFGFHITMRAEALERDGLSEADALAQAQREFGRRLAGDPLLAATAHTAERRRRYRRLGAELRQDLTYGTRLLARSPAFAIACIVTLAVGIGANTAVFSLVNAAFLAPPPVAAPDELMRVQLGESRMSPAVFDDLRRRSQVFSSLTAIAAATLPLGEPGSSRHLTGERVSTSYFDTLGVNAAIGRRFDSGLDRDDVVVLSERAWRSHFGGDGQIVGRRIQLDRRTYEVIGVMPRGFRGLAPPGLVRDCWIPVRISAQSSAASTFEVAGRLKAGVTQDQAAAAVRVTVQQLRDDRPELPDSIADVRLVPVTGLDAFRGIGTLVPVFIFIALLAVLSALVLAIGCANIAGLLLGRSVARRPELALRAALGAGRGRLLRQLLTESVLLAVIGGGAGILVAAWLTGLVPVALSQFPMPLDFDVSIDWRVLAYTAAVSLATAIVFGLAPARHAASFDLVAALRDNAQSGARQRLRQALIVAQVGVSAMLLVWGVLFTRSLGNAASTDPGFDAGGVLLADVSLGPTSEGMPDADSAQIVELFQRARELPFVESAGGAWAVPLTLSARESFSVLLDDDTSNMRGRVVNANHLTPGWFATLRIPLVAGRDFTWNDRMGTPEVAIVNRTLADRFWNGAAIGRRLRFTGSRDIPHDVEIVGVAADSKYWTLGESIEPTVYLAALQGPMSAGLTLHVRTSSPQDTSRRLMQEALRVAPAADVALRPMREATAVAMMPARVGAAVTGASAGVGILLATIGVYALISYSVARRTREIGVRKVLGATTQEVVRLLVGRSVTLVAIGLAGGIAAGTLGARVLGSLMIGVSPNDPLAIAASCALVLLTTVLASGVPAMRAARADPLDTLRRD